MARQMSVATYAMRKSIPLMFPGEASLMGPSHPAEGLLHILFAGCMIGSGSQPQEIRLRACQHRSVSSRNV